MVESRQQFQVNHGFLAQKASALQPVEDVRHATLSDFRAGVMGSRERQDPQSSRLTGLSFRKHPLQPVKQYGHPPTSHQSLNDFPSGLSVLMPSLSRHGCRTQALPLGQE